MPTIIKDTEEVNGQSMEILIEVEKAPEIEDDYYTDTRDLRERAREAIAAVDGVFGEGLRLAQRCAVRARDSLATMAESVQPDEFDIQFAIKLDSEVGAVIASTTTGGHIQVSMKWKKHDPNQPAKGSS